MIPRLIHSVRHRFGSSGLGNVSDRFAELWGNRTQFVDPQRNTSLSFNESAEVIRTMARHIGGTINPAEPVVIGGGSAIDQFLMCLAVSRAGGIAVPVNVQMTDVEIDHVMADSGATLLLLTREDALALKHPLEELGEYQPEQDEVAALFYTSGTTGAPKGAALTHRALVGPTTQSAFAPTDFNSFEVVTALPIAHIMGFSIAMNSSASGVANVVFDHFDPVEVLETISERSSTAFAGVPTMYRRMYAEKAATYDLSSVRVWISGADVMPHDLAIKFKKMGSSISLWPFGSVGDASFVEGYGLVEVGGGVAVKFSPPFVPFGAGTGVGFKLPGYSFRVLNEHGNQVRLGGTGELHVRGPGVLASYWNDEEATSAVVDASGWLATGDIVRLGPFSTIEFQSRSKHVIKSGGFSVYPAEVEGVLESHPKVAEACLLAMQDDILGEYPVAAVRVKKGEKLDSKTILNWIAPRVSRYKAPRDIRVVSEFPRTNTQKVKKSELEKLFRPAP